MTMVATDAVSIPDGDDGARGPERAGRGARRDWWLLGTSAAIVALVAAAYGSALAYPFELDDYMNIVHNQHLSRWDVAQWRLPAMPRRTVAVSFALNVHLLGVGPSGFRLVNLCIHALNGVLAFLLVRQALSGPRLRLRFAARASLIACLSSLLFIAHPLQTQAVTYIVQRCESLMATCMLLCLYALGRAAGSQESSGRWRGLAVIAALLGIECKEPGAVVLGAGSALPVDLLPWTRPPSCGGGSACPPSPPWPR